MTGPSTGKKYLPLWYNSLDNLKIIELDFPPVMNYYLTHVIRVMWYTAKVIIVLSQILTEWMITSIIR